MVTRVLDADGAVLHDCTSQGCVVSWDGYAITDQLAASANPPSLGAVTVKAGQLMPGAAPVDLSAWSVAGNTATARRV